MPLNASVVSFQMAVRDGDMPGARIDDKEIMHLAKTLAMADILCVAMVSALSIP